jgi:hypothetical protein
MLKNFPKKNNSIPTISLIISWSLLKKLTINIIQLPINMHKKLKYSIKF